MFTQRQTAGLRITLTFLLTLLKPRHPQQLASWGTYVGEHTGPKSVCAQELNCV